MSLLGRGGPHGHLAPHPRASELGRVAQAVTSPLLPHQGHLSLLAVGDSSPKLPYMPQNAQPQSKSPPCFPPPSAPPPRYPAASSVRPW